ncbi:MAG: FAD-binding oxidoreductase [Chloroflexi bacterium]|nr:MAG: FAD-binding oxidoreductase [Chloroflexota bacterium]
MKAVHDLWPRGVISRRAGAPAAEVEVRRPATYEEVASLLRSGTRMIPFGGLSGVVGAVAPDAGQVALDLGGFDRILAIDEVELTVHVQAGVRGLDLEQALNARGLTLGHHPSSLPVATVGGLISTRSSGQESTRHGSIEDMVLGLTVALPDGTLARPRPGPRSAVGPALHQLLVGAEGGLGVVLDAVLRVHRQPEAVEGRGWLFADVEAGLAAVREIVQSGVRPLVLRLYDPEDTQFQGIAEPGCLLVAATAGEPEVARAEAAVVARAAAAARDLGPEPWERWRRHRYDLSAERMLDMLEPPGAYLDTIEIAAGWRILPEVYREVKSALTAGSSLALCHFSHAYPQGCCAYFTFAGSSTDEEQALAAYDRCWAETMRICLARGATISHHHGVGQARAAWARQELDGWWPVWEKVRAALDPGGVMNPKAVGGR